MARLSDKPARAAAILFPFVLISLFANALVFDVQTHKSLLAPGAVPVTLQLLDYFRGYSPMPGIFDESERSHLEDVRQVVKWLGRLSLVLLVAFLALLSRADASRVFTRGFLLLLALAALLLIAPFDIVFEKFHGLLFAPGTWVFPAESTLIRMYPYEFFQQFFTTIMEHALLFGAVLALWAKARHR